MESTMTLEESYDLLEAGLKACEFDEAVKQYEAECLRRRKAFDEMVKREFSPAFIKLGIELPEEWRPE